MKVYCPECQAPHSVQGPVLAETGNMGSFQEIRCWCGYRATPFWFDPEKGMTMRQREDHQRVLNLLKICMEEV